MEMRYRMIKTKLKKPLKPTHKNPLLEKIKAKRKLSLSRPKLRRHPIYQVVRSSK